MQVWRGKGNRRTPTRVPSEKVPRSTEPRHPPSYLGDKRNAPEPVVPGLSVLSTLSLPQIFKIGGCLCAGSQLSMRTMSRRQGGTAPWNQGVVSALALGSRGKRPRKSPAHSGLPVRWNQSPVSGLRRSAAIAAPGRGGLSDFQDVKTPKERRLRILGRQTTYRE